MSKKTIIVTGGSGKAGKWIIKDLIENLTDLGQVHNAISMYSHRGRNSVDAVIHFAAIPQAYIFPNDVTYQNNVMNTYNILEASANLGIKKVVLASSESSYGICFAHEFFSPNYLPVDEAHPQLPEDSYGLSKVVNEITAEAFHRRTGMQVISFRLGNILEPDDYAGLKANFKDAEKRKWILWSYIDSRDVAIACRLAIEKDGLGAQSIILAADDTSSNLPTKELIDAFLPNVKDIRASLDGRTSLMSNEKAKKLLGWSQTQYWENQ